MTRIERVARGFAATSFAVMLAALSHVLAGGNTPSLAGILATVVVALPLSVFFAGRRLSAVRLSLLVLSSQAVFHFTFASVGSTAPAGLAGAAVSDALPSAHAAHHALTTGALVLESAGVSASALMWFSHLGAAVLTIALLVFGERAAVALADLFVAAFSSLRRTPLAPLRVERRLASLRVEVYAQLISRLLASSLSRRGPPLLSV